MLELLFSITFILLRFILFRCLRTLFGREDIVNEFYDTLAFAEDFANEFYDQRGDDDEEDDNREKV